MEHGDGKIERNVPPRSWSPPQASPKKKQVRGTKTRSVQLAASDGVVPTTTASTEDQRTSAVADGRQKDGPIATGAIRGGALRRGWRQRSPAPTILSLITAVAAIVAAGVRTYTHDPSSSLNAEDLASIHRHVLIPRRPAQSWQALVQGALRSDVAEVPKQGGLTLRHVLADSDGYHLAMAPAFFGFYGYFGALAAWEGELGRPVLEPDRLRSVAGASAGAMAAVLLASQIPPRTAAAFVSTMTLDKFADFPGILAAFRGNKFEAIMEDFLRQHAVVRVNSTASAPFRAPPLFPASPQMQHSSIPVAVSAFDIQTFSGRILRTGSMARAARASATFPFLFQPVGYRDDGDDAGHHRGDGMQSTGTDYLLIDGGLTDSAGLQGTRDVLLRQPGGNDPLHHTVINLSVGDFLGSPPGPTYFEGVDATTRVVSISLQGLPPCGPWAMSNGPKAVEASLKAMQASLDVPMFLGRDPNHYELHIDARGFWKQD
jgi:Patatin-like phospholipase